jgi:predicted dehydrogenase
MTEAEKLKIGVIGLGDHAWQSHLLPLREVAEVQVVGVFDPAPRAQERARAAGLFVYDSEAELLASVEAVLVTSPDRFHAASLEAAIAASVHALVEKPLCDSSQDLPRVRAALGEAKQKGLVVSSCHPRRFDPPFLWARTELPALVDRLGPVLDLRFDFFYHKPSKQGLHLGLLLDHANHEIDLVNWLFGATSFNAYKLYDSELRYAACGQRDDGLSFSFFGSRTLERRVYSELLRLRFERGELTIDTERGIATVLDFETGRLEEEACGTTAYAERFLKTNEDFIAACRGGASYLSPEELLINTEIGIALTEDGIYRHQAERP